MAERQRALPSWMAKKEVKVKEKAPLKNQRKRRAARAAFYCMNEAELVEAAVSFLTKGSCEDATFPLHQQVERKAKPASTKEVHPATSEVTSKPVEESSDCCDDLEMTYVSETDLDITEVETVPNIRNQQHPVPKGERSGSAEGCRYPMNNYLQAEKDREQLQTAAEEDDALQLVREIFFT
ncbi:hypothetical protein ILYODFUR_008599 [Ilyodon furcidens]|uniref:Uncharacterized protein n=1 Tax=Ilyodon furcidens TaxID=33524 RepID=A0ABV0SMY5_9TELE